MYGYRVKETTSTEGTGTIELNGAPGTGFRSFSDEFASGAKVIYGIVSVGSDGNGDYEIGIGTLTHGTPDTLTRDAVLRSSNGGSKVNWGPGQKVVFCDFAADYTPADRTAESISSAATTNIGAAAGNFVHITGTTTITSFGTAPVAGRRVTVTFDGALTLTHGSNLVLPGAGNITTAAGDVATFRADTTTKWVCETYTRADGRAVTPAGGDYFHAHKNGTDQGSIGNAADTKVTFGTELADTASVYDTSTSRFTPPNGTRWLISAAVNFTNAGSDGEVVSVALYKNGSAFKRGGRDTLSVGSIAHGADLPPVVVEGNGSDFYEIYVSLSNATGSRTIEGNADETWFQAVRIS